MRFYAIVWLILPGLLVTTTCHSQDVPESYKSFFDTYQPKEWKESLLNRIGLSEESMGRSFALVAGVSDYVGTQHDIAPASEDIRKVVSFLREGELFDEIVVLENEDMTFSNLDYFLRVYFPEQLKASPKSRFLFAYSGHGNEESGEGYILLSEAEHLRDKIHSMDMGVIRKLIDHPMREAYHTLILFNACHSGVFLQHTFGDDDLGALIPSEPGAHVITASGTSEKAYHDQQVGSGSIFFEKFLAGVRDKRADIYPSRTGDGIVQIKELIAYMQQEVQLARPGQNPRAGDIKEGRSTGGFYFVHRDRAVTGQVQQELGPALSFGPSTDALPTLPTTSATDSYIIIRSTERGLLRINEEERGEINTSEPVRLQVSPGVHHIEVSTGSKTYRESVRVQPGENPVVFANFDSWQTWPERFTDSWGATYVLIKPGAFTMGASQGYEEEQPAHRVQISSPFYLSTTEVRQSQWESVMKSHPSTFTNPDSPVENISWNDTQAFIRRLNSLEGCSNCYRLPTEAEWEYAAKAGSNAPFSLGDSLSVLDEYSWYWDNSYKRTWPVGQKKANTWGIYDIGGNVWEWVHDWYAPYDSVAVSDPKGPLQGVVKVYRGGGWNSDARGLRSTDRATAPPDTRQSFIGFRLVRTGFE